MSKAFTRESDGDGEDDEPYGLPPIPAGGKNYITPAGYARIRAELFELIDHSRIVNFTWIGPDLFAKAREWMLRYEDQAFSFTDCTSFACMKHLGIREAATTDRHFLTAGFAPLFV